MNIVTSKCPKCGFPLHQMNLENVLVGDPLIGPNYNAVSIVCPKASCRHVLGVSIDPISMKADIVRSVCEALGVKPKTAR